MKRPAIVFFALLYCVFSIAAAAAAADFFIYRETEKYIYANKAGIPEAQAALIPGAAVTRLGMLSPVLRDRANAAVALYMAGKVSKILVSGDNSTLSYNEVNPVRKYLLGYGIPDEDIFLDHAGFDTYSTMYRARDIFGVRTVIIATQSFHLPRAIFIARMLGMNAIGLNADSGKYLARNYVREAFADLKMLFDLARSRMPIYLGDSIPIQGDGRSNP